MILAVTLGAHLTQWTPKAEIFADCLKSFRNYLLSEHAAGLIQHDTLPLAWWKAKMPDFMKAPMSPAVLAPLARMMLAIPATSAAVERAFSNVAYVVDDKDRLRDDHAQDLSLVRSFLRREKFNLDLFLQQLPSPGPAAAPVVQAVLKPVPRAPLAKPSPKQT